MLFAVALVAGIALAGGMLLGRLDRGHADPEQALAEQVDALLPQIQCAQCGYPGCRPYAEAIAHNNAAIDRCPPGGESVRTALANLLGEPTPTLATDLTEAPAGRVARIDEERCIGCARCISACPVDAIVGARQWLHGVLESRCTGCELCLAPCPVDCIDLVSPDWRP